MKNVYVLTYTHESGDYTSVYTSFGAAIARLQQMDVNNTFELHEDVKIECQQLLSAAEMKTRLKASKAWKERRALIHD